MSARFQSYTAPDVGHPPTGGASLLVSATVSSVGEVAGGIVTRTIEGQDTTADDIEEDAVSGFVGGAVGHLEADFVHPPEEPTLPGTRRHAVGRRKLAKYDAAVKSRNNMEMLHAGVDVGVGTNAANGGESGILELIRLVNAAPTADTPVESPLDDKNHRLSRHAR